MGAVAAELSGVPWLWIPEVGSWALAEVVSAAGIGTDLKVGMLMKQVDAGATFNACGLGSPLGGPPGKEKPCAKPCDEQQQQDYHRSADPGDPGLVRDYRWRAACPDRHALAVTDSQGIFGDDIFFIEAQVTGHGSHKSAVKDSAGKLLPLFAFDGLQEARGNARGGGYLLESDAAHFPFAF